MSRSRRAIRPSIVSLLILLLGWSAQSRGVEAAEHSCADMGDAGLDVASLDLADLGDIDFATSAGAEAQALFDRGLLLLHSFEYKDAADAFRAAQAVEPDFALAYWGEAMTHNHPLWLEEDLDAGRAALAKLAETPEARRAKAPTAREQAYLSAVEILFGDGEKRARDLAYAEAMKALMDADADDLDAAAFYSLALMGTCHDGRDTAVYMRAAAVADAVFDRNRRHPGAVHYLIHATDDPVHAPLGLRAARVYADIAPAAGHALHMPSHIFLALGMWDETSSSNLASWTAVADRVAAEAGAVDRRNFHALLWWHYSLLQQGRHTKARELLDIMTADAAASGSRRTRAHLALMRAAQWVDGERPMTLPAAPDVDELAPSPRASVHYVDGMLALERGDVAAARAAHQAMKDHLAELAKERLERDGYTAGYTKFGPTRTAAARVMALQLEAGIARAAGDTAEVLRLLGKAVDAERDAPFGFGPPVPAKPSNELLGETLLALGRHDEALAQLETALRRTPRRPAALLALARVAGAQGNTELADATHATLRSVWREADSDASRQAEGGAGSRETAATTDVAAERP